MRALFTIEERKHSAPNLYDIYNVFELVLEYFDTVTRTWSNWTAIPSDIGIPNCWTVGGDSNFYLFGGYSSREVFQYNPTTGTWTVVGLV